MVLMSLMPSNRLVMRTILHTGLRVSDVLSLRADQIGPQFWVTEMKTGKRKHVGLPEPLLSDLRANSGPIWVFPSRCDENKHRTRQAVWADVKRAAKLFRLPQNVGPHSARKVYAVRLMAKYGDLKRVKRALNHKSDIVTMVYAMADQSLEAKGRRRRSARGPRV